MTTSRHTAHKRGGSTPSMEQVPFRIARGKSRGCTSASAPSSVLLETSIEELGGFVVRYAGLGGLEARLAPDSEGCHGPARRRTSEETRVFAHRSGGGLGRVGSRQWDDLGGAPLFGHRTAGARAGTTTQPRDSAAAPADDGLSAGPQGGVSRVWDRVPVAPRRTRGHVDRRSGPTPRASGGLPALPAGLFPPSGRRWASTPGN